MRKDSNMVDYPRGFIGQKVNEGDRYEAIVLDAKVGITNDFIILCFVPETKEFVTWGARYEGVVEGSAIKVLKAYSGNYHWRDLEGAIDDFKRRA